LLHLSAQGGRKRRQRPMLAQIDRKLLNILQADFPLVEQPFQAAASRLGLEEAEVLERARKLKEEGVIRQISASCDASKLGYKTTLVALHITQPHLEKAAGVISKHPGVSHNYSRNHYFNLWFTLALPGSSDLDKEVQTLARRAKADDILILPALKVFKLDTTFDLTGDGLPGSQPSPQPRVKDHQLSTQDRAIINQLQEELPLIERPFNGWATSLGIEVPAMLTHIQQLQQRGVVRRFGASLAHTAIGLAANAMICWQVPVLRVEEAGRQLASFYWVSHCYERQASPEWPFNLYTMVHQPTAEACREAAARMSLETGVNHYQMLFTVKEYKKTRVKYLV
jgi:DNA-binding Lrp family transcriptional regulator